MDSRFAAEIDAREEQVSQLRLKLGMSFIDDWRRSAPRNIDDSKMLPHFGQLFFNLRSGPLGARPIESHAGGSILETVRAMKRRKRGRQSVGDRLAALRLHSFPGLLHAFTVKMRMPRLHLRDEAGSDIVHVELVALFRNHRMKQYL